MKKLNFLIFLNLMGCSISLYRGDIPFIKDDIKSIKAPYPEDPMIGLSFDAISRDQNAIIFASFQGGYTWKGGAELYRPPDTFVAVETKFTYLQGSINFGVLPFYRIRPYIYPYAGIGLGIFSSEAYGVYKNDFTTIFYPYLRGGFQISFPFSKEILKGEKSKFSPCLNFSFGYQFSFERWLQGPYLSMGYSGFFPPEGIWAILLGGVLIILGGRE
ncbi:MAG: hypothetical protein ABIM85_03055 [candidate division WOR-3 bacterium]